MTAKGNHNSRYTQMIGKARMEMKTGLTFACMDLKKLTKMKQRWGLWLNQLIGYLLKYKEIYILKGNRCLDLRPEYRLATVSEDCRMAIL